MKIDLYAIVALLGLLLSACAAAPEHASPQDATAVSEEAPLRSRVSSPEEMPLRAMLAFYSANSRSPAPAPRERPVSSDPYLKMQLAIQFGHLRPPDLQRGMNLLASVMKDSNPAAVSLAPLARVLYEQYGERLRLEQQLREAQRRGEQLQEKIDALSAIERSLPSRIQAQPLLPSQFQQTMPITGAEETPR